MFGLNGTRVVVTPLTAMTARVTSGVEIVVEELADCNARMPLALRIPTLLTTAAPESGPIWNVIADESAAREMMSGVAPLAKVIAEVGEKYTDAGAVMVTISPAVAVVSDVMPADTAGVVKVLVDATVAVCVAGLAMTPTLVTDTGPA